MFWMKARARNQIFNYEKSKQINGIDCTFLAHFKAFAVGTIFLWFFLLLLFFSLSNSRSHDRYRNGYRCFFHQISGCLFIIRWWYHVYGDSMVVSLSIQKIIQSWWMLLIAWWCLEKKTQNTFKNVDSEKKPIGFARKLNHSNSNEFTIRKKKIG